jgi:hypothetical protein
MVFCRLVNDFRGLLKRSFVRLLKNAPAFAEAASRRQGRFSAAY